MGSRLDQITDWEALARLAGYRAGEMAALRGVSAGHLRRLFRKRSEGPLRDWIQKLRTDDAIDLLSKRKSIKELPSELGFSEHSNFCRFFKCSLGMTASAYLEGLIASSPQAPASNEGKSGQGGKMDDLQIPDTPTPPS